MPDKYDTYIEQGGSNVSGGQKQRLCIARALLKKPKILILDDSTSAVDTKTDAKIRAALRTEIPETTKFIIAQRISSIQDADLILVLDGGAINGMGRVALRMVQQDARAPKRTLHQAHGVQMGHPDSAAGLFKQHSMHRIFLPSGGSSRRRRCTACGSPGLSRSGKRARARA